MISDERRMELIWQTDLMTLTGPGTPGGHLLRSYWQPIILTREFPRGTPPRPLRVMGEDLVLFRDDKGRLGLLGLNCPHRCADLSYGRVEDGGLRCVYHGWLFDVDGNCLHQPSEPGGGKGREHYKHLSYPCVERSGAIWTYMGKTKPPLFPSYPALRGSNAYRYTASWRSNCNYLQANEGNIDPVHTSYLHSYDLTEANEYSRRSASVFAVDGAPKLSVVPSRYGLRIFAERRVPNSSKRILRVTNFIMPNACAIGGSETGLGRGGLSMFWHVPIDDSHHWRFEFMFHSKKRLPYEVIDRLYSAERLPDGSSRRNASNRYLQDLGRMGSEFAGMGHNFPTHDLFVTESQGEILDRTKENLVTSDIAIAHARRQLLAAIKDVQEGRDPVGIFRQGDTNDCRDLLVLTETLNDEIRTDDFCANLEQQDIYELDGAIDQTAAAE
jgi:phthalate 4,5-dioxygenase